MCDDEILSRKERAELVIKLTEALYTNHAPGGRPFATIPESVSMAAKIVGLALSEKVDALTIDASLHPDAHRKSLEAFALKINQIGASDQDRRATRFFKEMKTGQQPCTGKGDVVLP